MISPSLKRGAIVSAAAHVVVLGALLLGLDLRFSPDENPPMEVELAMEASQPGPAQEAPKAPAPSPLPSPAPQPVPQVTPEPPAPEPPKPAPVEPPPPPPPPPPPLPAPAPQPAPTPAPAPPLPVPPPPVPVPPAPPSQTSQPNPTKNPAPDSRELNNTLEKLRAMQRQTAPPVARANPAQGSSGGSPNGTLTDRLSNEQRGAVGDKVRECWTKDAGALDLEKMQAMLLVTVDADGVARLATVAPEDQGRMGDPRFRAFAERAIRAVLNPQCANLPIPHSLIDAERGTLKFRFKP